MKLADTGIISFKDIMIHNLNLYHISGHLIIHCLEFAWGKLKPLLRVVPNRS